MNNTDHLGNRGCKQTNKNSQIKHQLKTSVKDVTQHAADPLLIELHGVWLTDTWGVILSETVLRGWGQWF